MELSVLVLEHAKDSDLAGESAYIIAHCARKFKDTATQMECYHLIMEKYPKSHFAYRVPNELGLLYRKQKNYEQAEYWFTQQRELYNDRLFSSRSTFDLGIMYASLIGDYAKAVEVFENYIQWYPSGPGMKIIPIKLAICYDKLGRKTEAIAVLNDALETCKYESYAKRYNELINKIQEGS